MRKPACFFLWVTRKPLRGRWQGFSATKPWLGNWLAPARSESNVSFDRSRSGRLSTTSTKDICRREIYRYPRCIHWRRAADLRVRSLRAVDKKHMCGFAGILDRDYQTPHTDGAPLQIKG